MQIIVELVHFHHNLFHMEIILIVVKQEMLVHVVHFEDNNQQMHKYLIIKNNFLDFHYNLFLIKFEDVVLIHKQMKMVILLNLLLIICQELFV
jgi:hypothetical protein